MTPELLNQITQVATIFGVVMGSITSLSGNAKTGASVAILATLVILLGIT